MSDVLESQVTSVTPHHGDAHTTNGNRAAQGTDLSGIGFPEAEARELGQLFKLLAEETRMRILYYLTRRRELNVRQLCGLLQQSQPAVSHHLGLMRDAGLVEPRRDGKHNYYRIEPESFRRLLSVLVSALSDKGGYVELNGFVFDSRQSAKSA